MKHDEPTMRQILGSVSRTAFFVVTDAMTHWLCGGDAQTLADLGFLPHLVEGSRLGYSDADAAHTAGGAPNPWAKNIAAVRAAIEFGRTDEMIPIVEWRARFYESAVSPMYDPTGEIIGATLVVRDVSHRRRNEMQREAFARTDLLTQLANRHRFERVLKRIFQGDRAAAVLMCDLDGFKRVNDERGHEAGDVCLTNVARALENAVRPTDTVARLGGDEFAILLAEIPSPDLVHVVADRVRAAVERLPYEIGISVGAAIYPEDGRDSETLRKVADVAMYADKRARKAVR